MYRWLVNTVYRWLVNTVYRWLKRFSSEIFDISDTQHSGMPIEVIDKFHTEKVKELLDGNGRYTFDVLAESVGISHGSVNWPARKSRRSLNIALDFYIW